MKQLLVDFIKLPAYFIPFCILLALDMTGWAALVFVLYFHNNSN